MDCAVSIKQPETATLLSLAVSREFCYAGAILRSFRRSKTLPRGQPPKLGSIAKESGYREGGKFSGAPSFSTFGQASGNSGGTRVAELNSPFGPITGMHHRGGNDYGGTHHTVYTDGGHFSWDTNASGQVVPGSAHSTTHK